jgi:hypothetical protein
MNKFLQHIFVCGILWLISAPAFAMQPQMIVTLVHGKVLVSAGIGFSPAEVNLPLKDGDKIMIGQKSLVEIYYVAQSCTVTYAAPAVVTVAKSVPCIAGEKIGMANSAFVKPTFAFVPPAVLPVLLGVSQPAVGLGFIGYNILVPPLPVSLP